jgi:predicted enzyme related to lactoylglutathione lyase
VVYQVVDDIRGRLQTLTSAGAQVVQDVRDVGGGRLVASLKDADGNMLGLMQDTA